MAKFTTLTFTNDDLDSNFEVELIHGKNTENVILSWVDENNIDRTTTDVFTVLDANTIKVSCGSSVTGTQTVVVCYDDILSITGRKLFGLANLSSPYDQTYRLALGKENAPAVNVTLRNFLTWLGSVLPFMKGSNNLLDVTNKGAARSNLNVYSKTEVDARVLPKLDAYSSGMGYGLGHLNTAPYTPVGDYNPATKKYVDDKFGGLVFDTINFSDKNAAITVEAYSAAYITPRFARLRLDFKLSGSVSNAKLGQLTNMRHYAGGSSTFHAISVGTHQAFVTINADGEIFVTSVGPVASSQVLRTYPILILE